MDEQEMRVKILKGKMVLGILALAAIMLVLKLIVWALA